MTYYVKDDVMYDIINDVKDDVICDILTSPLQFEIKRLFI